jgi:hypothetical protein
MPERADLNIAYRGSGKLPESGEGAVPQDLLSVAKARLLESQEISSNRRGLHTPLEVQSIGKEIVPMMAARKDGAGNSSAGPMVHPDPITSREGRPNLRTGGLKLSYHVHCSEKQDRLRGASPTATESP